MGASMPPIRGPLPPWPPRSAEKKKSYSVSGYPAFFLCVLPMLVGYIVIVKAVINAIF